jgi:hypothetical protein
LAFVGTARDFGFVALRFATFRCAALTRLDALPRFTVFPRRAAALFFRCTISPSSDTAPSTALG